MSWRRLLISQQIIGVEAVLAFFMDFVLHEPFELVLQLRGPSPKVVVQPKYVRNVLLFEVDGFVNPILDKLFMP